MLEARVRSRESEVRTHKLRGGAATACHCWGAKSGVRRRRTTESKSRESEGGRENEDTIPLRKTGERRTQRLRHARVRERPGECRRRREHQKSCDNAGVQLSRLWPCAAGYSKPYPYRSSKRRQQFGKKGSRSPEQEHTPLLPRCGKGTAPSPSALSPKIPFFDSTRLAIRHSLLALTLDDSRFATRSTCSG